MMDFYVYRGNHHVYNRVNGHPATTNTTTTTKRQKVCYHWRAGNCTRYSCPYLHRELPAPAPAPSQSQPQQYGTVNGNTYKCVVSNGLESSKSSSTTTTTIRGSNGYNRVAKKMEKVCSYWVQGKCVYGDKCRFLHSWSLNNAFSLLTQLKGHEKIVSGIAFPPGSDKLYTGSIDETVRVWDCQSGECLDVVNVGGEVGCLVSEGPWIFVGMPNVVKAWNSETNTNLTLDGPVGQVYALVMDADLSLLFAGTQDGTILVWKFNNATNNFEPAASLEGHTLAVVSLVIGAKKLYSGSMDNSIRGWKLENLECVYTLTAHTSVVMSVLCWDQFLLSSSLDKTIKVWACAENGNLEVIYNHDEEHGVLKLCGMYDLEGKPMLLCVCNDSSVRIYDLPTFSKRGQIFVKEEIRAIQTGPKGIFFTGDGTGQVSVWNCSTESMAVAQSGDGTTDQARV